jgi:hypothetical protein
VNYTVERLIYLKNSVLNRPFGQLKLKEKTKMAAQKWQYVGQCTVPAVIDSHITTAWNVNLKASMTRIYDALTTKIATGTDFTTKIVTPSSLRYTAFLATVGAGWDKDTIVLKQAVKLGASYTSWAAAIKTVFGAGGTFPTIVDAKKAKFENVKRTLAVTGQKSFSKWGAAPNAVLLLRGDSRPLIYIASPDTFTGTLDTAFDAVMGALLSPSIIAELVYGCTMAQYANDAGLTTLRDNIIIAVNAQLVTLMTAALIGSHSTSTLVIAWNTGLTPARVQVTATSMA